MDVSKMAEDFWHLFKKDYQEEDENFYFNLTYRTWDELDYNLSYDQQKRLINKLIELNEKEIYDQNNKEKLLKTLRDSLKQFS